MPVIHREVSFSGHTPSAVGRKLLDFQNRCAAASVLCHCGPGEVAFGLQITATYAMTLSGEAEDLGRVLGPRREAAAGRRCGRRGLGYRRG